MGEVNQFSFVRGHASMIRGPILEVGSKDHGSKQDFRSLFPHCEYVGADMEAGNGVDVVVDFTDDFPLVHEKLHGRTFQSIFCFSTLEHCREPFSMSRNISRLLGNNGLALISVPFAWRLHGYPADYWRFTPDGIRVLFPEFEFDLAGSNLCTNRIDEFQPIDDYLMCTELRLSRGLKRNHYGYLAAGIIFLFKKLGILPAVFGYPYVYPPVLVNMIVRKTREQQRDSA